MIGKRKTPKISHNRSVSTYVLLALLVVLAIAAVTREYWMPVEKMVVENHIGTDSESLRLELKRQRKVIEALHQERTNLQGRIAQLERMSQIDQESISRVQEQLRRDQDARLTLEEELIFLRSIVSSKVANGGLNLQNLRLKQGKSEKSVVYNFTISKVIQTQGYVEGAVYLTLNGLEAGSKRSIHLQELTNPKVSRLKMRFRHFLNMEGELLIPDRFKPTGVTIEVKPTGEKYSPFKKSYKWNIVG